MYLSFSNITDFASAVRKSSKHFFFTSHALAPGGTGLYGPVSYLVHPSLPNHTIYTPHPRTLLSSSPPPEGGGERLPVLVWANGMGFAWGLMFGPFLQEVASHGYVVIANGRPGDETDREMAAAAAAAQVMGEEEEDDDDDDHDDSEDGDHHHHHHHHMWDLHSGDDQDGGGDKRRGKTGHTAAKESVKKAGRKARKRILGAARRGGVGLARLHQVDVSAMLEAVEWVLEATEGAMDGASSGLSSSSSSSSRRTAGKYPPGDIRAHLDGSRIALGGQSKGGLDAYEAAAVLATRDGGKHKGRIRTVGLFNAGLVQRTAALEAQVRALEVPTVWVVGGPADLAWRNAKMDWEIVAQAESKRRRDGERGGGVPVWMGNLDVGHMGTFYDEDGRGGQFGRAALDWLAAWLKGDEAARRRMVDEYPRHGWEVQARNWVPV